MEMKIEAQNILKYWNLKFTASFLNAIQNRGRNVWGSVREKCYSVA